MIRRVIFVCVMFFALPAVGQNYDLSWHTIAGGAAPTSNADGYELFGTVAQPDADADVAEMTADGYSLVGGFWSAVVPHCTCLADLNSDDRIDGADIQRFLDCALADDGNCGCADVDRSGDIAPADLSIFIDTLLSDAGCH